jgi:hypothetical protein
LRFWSFVYLPVYLWLEKKMRLASLSRVPAFKRGEVLIMQRMDYINSAISVEGGGL